MGRKGAQIEKVRMDPEQHMGKLYPFSLADKLKVITEPSPWYTPEGGGSSPWGRAVVPLEMVSVLGEYTSHQAGFSTHGPAVGLFAGQQIRMIDGPLFVGEDYELEREIVALSESRRTESNWVKTTSPGGELGQDGGRDDPQPRHPQALVREVRGRSRGPGLGAPSWNEPRAPAAGRSARSPPRSPPPGSRSWPRCRDAHRGPPR